MYTRDGMDRREMMGTVGRSAIGVAVGGLAVFGIRGCISSCRQESRDGYAQAGERLGEIAGGYYPEFKDHKEQARKPKDVPVALREADKALVCYGELLSVGHPVYPKLPVINNIHDPGSNSDGWLNENDMQLLPEYHKAKLVCERLRDFLPAVLELSHDHLQEALHDPRLSQDPYAARYLATITPRLEILALHMRQGKLMLSDNVLHTRHKVQYFAELVGQTQHYEEARAEMHALLEYLERTEQQRTDDRR